MSTAVFEDLATADIKAAEGDRCYADVLRLRSGQEPQENWPLTAEQRTGVLGGSLELLKIVTVCEGGA